MSAPEDHAAEDAPGSGSKRRRDDSDAEASAVDREDDAHGDEEDEDEEDDEEMDEDDADDDSSASSSRPRQRRRIRGRNIDDDSDDDLDGGGAGGGDGRRRRRRGGRDGGDGAGGGSNNNNNNGEDSGDDGEDIHAEEYERDYRAIPALDTYERRNLDNREYDEISAAARRAADADMRRRDRREMARTGRAGGARLPAALQESDDDMSDFEPTAARRRMAERAAGEDVEFDEDEVDFALEDFGDVPLSEWLAQDRPRAEIKKQFRHFLRTYRDPQARSELPRSAAAGTTIYSQRIDSMCAANEQSLMVNYEHLSDAYPNLAVWLADAPKAMLQIFDDVATEVVLAQYDAYADIHDEIFVRISDLPIKDKLRDLRQANLHQLVRVEGVVTRRTSVFPQLKFVRWRCSSCQYLLDPQRVEGQQQLPKPTSCPQCQGHNLTLDINQSLYRNYQKLTLQESPSKVPAGRVPRRKDVLVGNDLIDAARPGEEVLITGIYENTYDIKLNGQNGFPVFSTVISANYIQKLDAQVQGQMTEEDLRAIHALGRNERIGELVVESIAPSIYGCEDVKRACALAMFGGQEKDINGKHHVRGDINCLLLGDPGVAKSQFLKYIEKTAPRTVYATGKGATAVGLTAAVHRDPVTKEWTLEGGALVLADRGICLIDEFDKMNDADRTSIHEAMEQQSISISKAGIVTTLKARCSVIAAANPIGGRYDPQRSLAENVELTDPILSRFDILCVLQDHVDPVQDERLARFVVGSHVRSHKATQQAADEAADLDPSSMPPSAAGSEVAVAAAAGGGASANAGDPGAMRLMDAPAALGDGSGAAGGGGAAAGSQVVALTPSRRKRGIVNDAAIETIPQDLLKKYLAYARANVRPQLGNIDENKLVTLYQELRRDSITAGGVPVAVRHIESIVRIAEANARMHLRDHVRNEDVDMAIRVMVESFIAAQKYSVQTTLRKKFRKYIVYKKHNNSLIMHILQQMVRDQVGVFFPVVSGGYCSQVFFLGLMFVRCMFSLTCVLHATVFSLLFGRRR